MRQIEVQWSTPAGGAVSVFNLDDAIPVAGQRAGIQAFLNDFAENQSTEFSWTIPTEGRELDPATGLTQDFWSDPTLQTGNGDTTANYVPDATQVLFRWRTDAVVAGRRVQGRTFMPGLLSSLVVGGNVQGGALVLLQGMATALVESGIGLGVWSRPTEGRAGSFALATQGSVWSEFAVQRGRRG